MKSNYLLIIIAIFLLSQKKDDRFKQILSSVSVEDALSLLKYFGIDEQTINSIIELLPDMLSGNPDILSILKKSMPLILSFMQNPKSDQAPAPDRTAEGAAPVADFVPDEIRQNLEEYFS